MKRPARPGETRESSRPLILTPGEKSPHHTRIGAAGVGIGDPGGEKLIGGKQRIGAGALEHGRDRSGWNPGPGKPGRRAVWAGERSMAI